MRVVGGEKLINASSFCPGEDEDRFPSRRIALDRGVCHTTSGRARPSMDRLGRGQGHQHRLRAAGTSI